MNKTTVLIVEDEAIVAEDLANKLRQQGYEVVGIADRGKEAVEKACRLLPGIVLMDIRLKGSMDGIEAAEAIRGQSDIPVVFLTAHSDTATLERAKAADPFGYILKPFGDRELAKTIEMAIYKHQSDRKLRKAHDELELRVEERTRELKRAKERLREMNETLEQRVAERTAELESANALLLKSRRETEEAIVGFRESEVQIHRHMVLMEGINRIFQYAMNGHSQEGLGERCLAVVEELTGSRFGFIGEIGPDGCLHDLAISNPGWDACTMIDRNGHRRPPGNFKVHGIYGRVLQDGRGFFTNDPTRHPDSIGIPPGHPPLTSFLGVPLVRDGRTYGMIAVANREGGYDPHDLEMMELIAPVVVEVFLRNRAEVALKERERRLRRAEEMAHLGHWRFDLATGLITWSDEIYRIFGLNQEELPSERMPEEVGGFCHPDDLEHCIRSFDASRVHEGKTCEYRIVRPNGEERHLVSNGELLRDEYDNPVALFGTLLDATELRLKERDLESKNAELERFAYMISHDLKSPLVTLKTFLSYLDKDLANSDATRIAKDINFMRTAADKMWRLLDELLEMSRVGRIANQPVRADCGEVIEEALTLVAGPLAERGVEVLATYPGITFFGDRQRLVEIWQNLLENACKFMGEQTHPRVEVGARGRGRQTVFFVRDNGIGIEEKYLDKIFGLFEKLDQSSEGTGLGLALVTRIVELNGGKVWVESRGLGKGACFYFTLPAVIEISA